ncbi:hypothetical protein B0H14DRAFT_3432961 [Mycena olivaceomarginata]|nr:hypothetical protein B0H14DRAFT_3432961 [Mycena olivaceomarginata]
MYWGLATYTITLTELDLQAKSILLSDKERTPVVRHLGERVVEAVPSGDPAFSVALSTGEVAIMNYSRRDRGIIPTTTSPEHFNNDAPGITFPVPACGVSHPHLSMSEGTRVYSITGSTSKGSGPTHIRISNNRPLHLTRIGVCLSKPSLLDSHHLLRLHHPPGAVWAAAGIFIPPPSARFNRYIYVSNCNTGVQTPTAGSISIFKNVGQGTPEKKLVTQVFTGLNQIRG